MENKDGKKALDDKIDSNVKNIDPTTLGGLDGSGMPNLDEEALNWTKSRGKKKD